jgi:predicted aconitase with swiveling domain
MGSLMDFTTGTITIGGHDLEGKSVKDSILVYDTDIYSTTGAMGLLNLATIFHTGPRGIIWREAHNISASAAIYAGIPAVDRLREGNPCELIRTGDWVRIDADRGVIEVARA